MFYYLRLLGASFFLEITFLPALQLGTSFQKLVPAARDQLPKVGGGSSSGCPFLSWSLPSTALRILNELVYLNSKHE